MNTRRDFLKLAAAAGMAGAAGRAIGAEHEPPPATPPTAPAQSNGAEDRAYWASVASRLARPLLEAASRRRLKAEMPVEAHAGVTDRPQFTHLEALGRLLCGLAPWLELDADRSEEGQARGRFAELARLAVDAATDPTSPDRLNFSAGRQPLVDAAFLAQAMLRAPNALWRKLDSRVQAHVIAALQSSRVIPAYDSNWKLFCTMIEVFLQRAGVPRDENRLWEGIRKHRDWYLGDGVYGDGPEFHWDYYNSFVIQPMLVEALETVGHEAPEWSELLARCRARLTRWAAIQERLIAPDGTYPIVGRSITYRCGAFQSIAMAALRHMLPAEVLPAQARVALTSVIRRTLEAPGTWDDHGWLRIGVSGHQPALGEPYISTGSLYLCSVALLPLGLPPADPFWSEPPAPTTWQKAWSGQNLPADHALR
jgi:hypothetical protein